MINIGGRGVLDTSSRSDLFRPREVYEFDLFEISQVVHEPRHLKNNFRGTPYKT